MSLLHPFPYSFVSFVPSWLIPPLFLYFGLISCHRKAICSLYLVQGRENLAGRRDEE